MKVQQQEIHMEIIAYWLALGVFVGLLFVLTFGRKIRFLQPPTRRNHDDLAKRVNEFLEGQP
jgi:peptidoglycan biosynthesis protein MviN/MurJ (putative lipid II flippase)